MASAFDVAEYILQKTGPIPAMKLQKLCYYAQAWHLVWDDEPLFNEKVEAWANGPVIPDLYQRHRGQFIIEPGGIKKDARKLPKNQADSVDAILETYGGRTSLWLSDLTHREAPWCDARAGLAPGERGNHTITHAAMAEYYGALQMAKKGGAKWAQEPSIAKQAKFVESPAVRKQAKASEALSTDKQTPAWQFHKLDREHSDWGWDKLGFEGLCGLLHEQLANFESMTWAEIQGASGGRTSGNNSHFVPVAKCCKSAGVRLTELKMDDVDELFSLRLTGTLRLYGIREGRVMRFIWHDPHHGPSDKAVYRTQR